MKRFKIIEQTLESYQEDYKGMGNHISIGLEGIPIASKGLSLPSQYLISLESEHDEQSVMNTLKKVAKQIAEWVKSMWRKFMSFASKVKQYFSKVVDRTELTIKRLRNAKFLSSRYLKKVKDEIKQEQESSTPNQTKVTELVAKAAELTKTEVPKVSSINEAVSVVEEMSNTDTVNPEVLRQLELEIEEGDYLLFHPDKDDRPFSLEALKRHEEISNEYLRYVLFCKDNLNPEKFVDAVDKHGRGKEKVVAKQLAKALVDALVAPFHEYRYMDKVDENLTHKVRLNAKFLGNKAKRDILTHATKPATGLSKYVGGYLENFIEADKSRQPKRPDGFKVSLNDVRQFAEAIKKTQTTINTNRAHIFDKDNHQLSQGFFLTTEGVEKMLTDMKLPKGSDRRAIGQVLIEVSKECDSLINKAHSHWLRVANIQMEYLTSLSVAIDKLTPKV